MRIPRLALTALAVLLLTGAADRAQAQTKVAFVDLQRALLEVQEGKAAKARLQKEFNKRQKTLDASQEELLNLKKELDRKSEVMDPEKRREKEAELERKWRETRDTYVTLQTELSQQEKELTDRIFGKMQSILQEIAEADGIDMIFERGGGVLFAKDSLDLTGELIRKYNVRYGAAGAKAAPSAPAAGGKKTK